MDADVRFLSTKFHTLVERLHDEEQRRREAESLHREVADQLRAAREEHVNEGQRLRTEVDGLRSQNQTLIARLNELKREADDKASSLRGSARAETQLQQRLMVVTEKCAELNETCRLLRTGAEEQEETLAKAQAEVQSLRAQHD